MFTVNNSCFIIFTKISTMSNKVASIEEYINNLADDRKEAVTKLMESVRKLIDSNYKEELSHGMIGYVVPHSIFPSGYHCDPKLPLPYMNIASQKSHIAVYHMGLYASQELMDWFTAEYPKHTKAKLDMGKSCIRFKKTEHIPYDLIGQLAAKQNAQQWIACYQEMLNKSKKN